MSLKVQETELRRRPDIVIATPGRLVDHIQNTHSFDLETIEVMLHPMFSANILDSFIDSCAG